MPWPAVTTGAANPLHCSQVTAGLGLIEPQASETLQTFA
jgi:hypothetical protein